MTWHDLVLDKTVADAELEGALATSFGVDAGEVYVVHSVQELPMNYCVAAVKTDLTGAFHTMASIYATGSFATKSVVEVARALCIALGTRVLISDESSDPYTMNLVDGTGTVRGVNLDPQALDERGEYEMK